jgi:glycosyltransferase involved in cell wall biosynthesis
VWDNLPVPQFNKVLYDSTDLINCHSHMTYSFVKDLAPGRTNFIPHALPKEVFFPIEDDKKVSDMRVQVIGEHRRDHFVLFWVNRNAKRKRPNDLLWAWQLFMKMLQEKHGKSNATLLMHTQPDDQEGPNLRATAEMLGITPSLVFSPNRIDFAKMNVLHNISDACINISYAEGFGLSTLEAMQCGKPIVALKTGGLTRQAVDHRDGTENGVALPVEMQSLVGSQSVPYIYEDYCSAQTTANAIMKLYEMGSENRKALGQKAREYALSEFSLERTVSEWDRTLTDLTTNWSANKKSWEIKEL